MQENLEVPLERGGGAGGGERGAEGADGGAWDWRLCNRRRRVAGACSRAGTCGRWGGEGEVVQGAGHKEIGEGEAGGVDGTAVAADLEPLAADAGTEAATQDEDGGELSLYFHTSIYTNLLAWMIKRYNW